MGLDMSAALAAVDDDKALLRSVLEAMLEEIPAVVTRLREALSAGDAKSVQIGAHTIYGTMRLFPEQPLRDLARQMEDLGEAQQLREANEIYDSLRIAAEEFASELKASLDG